MKNATKKPTDVPSFTLSITKIVTDGNCPAYAITHKAAMAYSTTKMILICTPTGNCQLSSLMYAYLLFTVYDKQNLLKRIFIEIKKISRPILLIDIQAKYKKDLNKLRKHVKSLNTTPYTSTNGSKMLLIRLVL